MFERMQLLTHLEGLRQLVRLEGMPVLGSVA